jgi:predicted nucleotidyltransferase
VALTQALSPLQQLRQVRHGQWLDVLQRRLGAALAAPELPPAQAWAIYLFGSRARGDWDGYSDTDLLVVAQSPELAASLADLISEAGIAEDVLAIDQAHWQGLDQAASPYWAGIKRQAQRLAGQLP